MKGVMRRYKSKSEFPEFPNETISLTDIVSCNKIPMPFKEGNEFCFTLSIIGKKGLYEEKYMIRNLQAYEKWVDVINRNLSYSKFWEKYTEMPVSGRFFLMNETNMSDLEEYKSLKDNGIKDGDKISIIIE